MQLNLTDYEAQLLEQRLRGRTVSFSDRDHVMVQNIADRLGRYGVSRLFTSDPIKRHTTRRETDEYACSCGARWDVSDVDGHP